MGLVELLGETLEVGMMLLTIGSSIATLLDCWFLTHFGGDGFLICVKVSLTFSTFVEAFSTLGFGMFSSCFVFEVTVGTCLGNTSRTNVCLQCLQTSTEEFEAGDISAAESFTRTGFELELFTFGLSAAGERNTGVSLSTCTPTEQLSYLFVGTQLFTLGDVWVPKSLVLAQLFFLVHFRVFLASEATSCKDSHT